MTDGNARAAKAFSLNTLLMHETVVKTERAQGKCKKTGPPRNATEAMTAD